MHGRFKERVRLFFVILFALPMRHFCSIPLGSDSAAPRHARKNVLVTMRNDSCPLDLLTSSAYARNQTTLVRMFCQKQSPNST